MRLMPIETRPREEDDDAILSVLKSVDWITSVPQVRNNAKGGRGLSARCVVARPWGT